MERNVNNFNIEQFLDLSDYATDKRKARRKGKNGTQEFFTPYSIVKKMCDKISDEDWQNPSKTFLEPCCGNGNFIIYIIWNRIQHCIDWKTALETLYGVELMQDNVDETKERIIDLLNKLNIEYDKDVAYEIMNRNIVCSDFFKWNFEEWRPYTEDEIKLSTPIKATRARLTLEINKEGNLITSTNGLVEENRDFIYFSNIDGTNSGQIIMNIGDQVVIGENIVTVTSATSSSIMVDKTIYVKDDTPIYRVAYDAKISTKLVKIDEESHLETIVDGSENIYNLTLKSVITNGNNNSNFSDRLVFETDSDIELKEFNKVDLQIRWHSNLTSEVLKAQLLKDNDCVGRIKTLSLTFDEKLNNI